MIKVRVDWRYECPSCGTQLEVDFFDGVDDSLQCPWCGNICSPELGSEQADLREYLAGAIEKLEKEANTRIPV